MRKFIIKNLIFLSVLALTGVTIGCPLYLLTNFQCPMCGMTRAHITFLQGELETAKAYHSLFYLGVPTCLGFLNIKEIQRFSKKLYFAVCIFLFVSVTLLIVRYVLKIIL